MSSSFTSIRPIERRLFFEGPLVVITAFSVLEFLAPGLSASVAGWPILISLFLVGMPHGAADLAVNSHLTNSRSLSQQFSSFAGYSLALFASLVIFLLKPDLALMLFVVLSALHFGLADARDLGRRTAAEVPPLATLMSAVSRGCLVLGLPFLLSPTESLTVFENIVELTGRSAPPIDNYVVSRSAGAAVLAAVIIQAAMTTVRLSWGQSGLAELDLVESGLISLSFFALHPLFAMGLYVLTWHSWRHLFLLINSLPRTSHDGSLGSLLKSISRLHLESLPLLVPTVAAFGFIAWWKVEAWNSEMLAALTIAFFAVVTLPHHLLIERLTRYESDRSEEADQFNYPPVSRTFPLTQVLRSVEADPSTVR